MVVEAALEQGEMAGSKSRRNASLRLLRKLWLAKPASNAGVHSGSSS
jgi:hypothetical protein